MALPGSSISRAEPGGGCAGRSVGSARLNNVGLLVLDEVHYLGDRDRGTVWEEVIISCLPHMRLLAMSATIANARQLGGWLSEVRLRLAASHLGPWNNPHQSGWSDCEPYLEVCHDGPCLPAGCPAATGIADPDADSLMWVIGCRQRLPMMVVAPHMLLSAGWVRLRCVPQCGSM